MKDSNLRTFGGVLISNQLHSTRLCKFSGMGSVGFEPTSMDFQSIAFTRLAYFPRRFMVPQNHPMSFSVNFTAKTSHHPGATRPLCWVRIRTSHGQRGLFVSRQEEPLPIKRLPISPPTHRLITHPEISYIVKTKQSKSFIATVNRNHV